MFVELHFTASKCPSKKQNKKKLQSKEKKNSLFIKYLKIIIGQNLFFMIISYFLFNEYFKLVLNCTDWANILLKAALETCIHRYVHNIKYVYFLHEALMKFFIIYVLWDRVETSISHDKCNIRYSQIWNLNSSSIYNESA